MSTIKKATKLANNFHYDNEFFTYEDTFGYSYKWKGDLLDNVFLAALADQLKRQVDALGDYWVCEEDDRTIIYSNDNRHDTFREFGKGRNMTTIRCIVLSKVLEK